MKFIYLCFVIFVAGCTTIEYTIHIPVRHNTEDVGNIVISTENVHINYKHQTMLQFNKRK